MARHRAAVRRRRFARTRAVYRVIRHPGRAAKRQARKVSRRAQRKVRAVVARRLARMRRAWRQAYVAGGPTPNHPGVQRHKVHMPKTPPRPRPTPTTTTSRPRPAGGNHTMSQTTPTGITIRTGTPETEAVRKGGLGIAGWEPVAASEVHEQLAGLGVAVASVSAGILQYAETLAGMGADPRRIVNPLIELAAAIGSNAGDLTKLARTYRYLYGRQIEQEDAGVRPMTFGKAA